MDKITTGCSVHVTNTFDRLFFDEIGTVTETRQNQDLTFSYYIDVPRLSHGRWFQREDFEMVGEQQEKNEDKPDSLVPFVWDFSSLRQHITVHVDGKRLAQLMSRKMFTSPVYQWSGITPPPPHHDGGLDNRYDVYLTKEGVDISDSCDDHVDLSPKAALSLLAWLRQQENELQQLAQEDKA